MTPSAATLDLSRRPLKFQGEIPISFGMRPMPGRPSAAMGRARNRAPRGSWRSGGAELASSALQDTRAAFGSIRSRTRE
jgi:hypothetical protein